MHHLVAGCGNCDPDRRKEEQRAAGPVAGRIEGLDFVVHAAKQEAAPWTAERDDELACTRG